MHSATVIATFVTIFVAELPDKTMIATVVLSARFRRPRAVWLGAAAALTLQMAIAVAAGQALGLLPDRLVRSAVAVLFAIGAFVLWRSARRPPATDTDPSAERTDGADTSPKAPASSVAATVFGIVFVAEWGDLTQLTAASLASNGRPGSVFVGAALAMVSVAAVGTLAGRALLRVMPEPLLQRVAAVIFAGLAVTFAVSAVIS